MKKLLETEWFPNTIMLVCIIACLGFIIKMSFLDELDIKEKCAETIRHYK